MDGRIGPQPSSGIPLSSERNGYVKLRGSKGAMSRQRGRRRGQCRTRPCSHAVREEAKLQEQEGKRWLLETSGEKKGAGRRKVQVSTNVRSCSGLRRRVRDISSTAESGPCPSPLPGHACISLTCLLASPPLYCSLLCGYLFLRNSHPAPHVYRRKQSFALRS